MAAERGEPAAGHALQCAGNGFLPLFASVFASGSGVLPPFCSGFRRGNARLPCPPTAPGCGAPLCEIEEPTGESGRSAAAGYCSDIYYLYIINIKLQILLFANSVQGAPHQRQKGGAEEGVGGRKSGRAPMLLSPTVPLAAHCANTKAPRAEGECSRVAFGGNIRLSLLDGTGGAPLKRYRAPLWRQPDLRRKGERSALSLGGRVAGLR